MNKMNRAQRRAPVKSLANTTVDTIGMKSSPRYPRPTSDPMPAPPEGPLVEPAATNMVSAGRIFGATAYIRTTVTPAAPSPTVREVGLGERATVYVTSDGVQWTSVTDEVGVAAIGTQPSVVFDDISWRREIGHDAANEVDAAEYDGSNEVNGEENAEDESYQPAVTEEEGEADPIRRSVSARRLTPIESYQASVFGMPPRWRLGDSE